MLTFQIMQMDNSLNKLAQLHPKLIDDAIKAYNEAVKATPVGVHPYITQTIRTFEEQAILYAQGRTTPGDIVTDSKPGQSYHNYGLGLDFVLIVGGKYLWAVNNNWMVVVNCFKKYGFTWGGDFSGTFKDYPHLENKLGHNWQDLLVKYNNKDFIPGNTFVNI